MEIDARPAYISRTQALLKHHKIIVIIISFTLTLFGVLALSLVLYTWDTGRIANGVVLEIPLGQLSIEEAQRQLEQKRKEIYSRPIDFISDGTNFSITLEELGLTWLYHTPLQQAYLIGREGTIMDKAISKHQASWGITFKPDYQWNELILAEALTKRLSSLNYPAVDAQFSITQDNSMQITSEKLGKQVDIDSLMKSVKKLTPDLIEIILIPFNTVTPLLTKTELEQVKMTGLISSYTTYFDPTLTGRSYNIKLAAQAIDDLLLKPGEEFSFNQTVGPRTVEAGYQMAMIIEGDHFVPGLGGGVCQVSSTLYNAVRLGNLRVIERSHHSLNVTYVPPGQDATVAYPILDFKFKNNSEGYLLIRSLVDNNTVAFSLYGKGKY